MWPPTPGCCAQDYRHLEIRESRTYCLIVALLVTSLAQNLRCRFPFARVSVNKPRWGDWVCAQLIGKSHTLAFSLSPFLPLSLPHSLRLSQILITRRVTSREQRNTAAAVTHLFSSPILCRVLLSVHLRHGAGEAVAGRPQQPQQEPCTAQHGAVIVSLRLLRISRPVNVAGGS